MATLAVFPSSFIIFLVSESIDLSLLRICVAWAATFCDMSCISALTSTKVSNLPWSYVCVPPHSSHLNQPYAKVQLYPNHSAIQPTMISFFQSVFVINKTVCNKPRRKKPSCHPNLHHFVPLNPSSFFDSRRALEMPTELLSP
jgi:hypothetical protein